jgi:hypothetical protein
MPFRGVGRVKGGTSGTFGRKTSKKGGISVG